MSDNVIGKKITEYRKQNKMTQQEFADKLFVTNKTVSRWETGYTLPNGEQLVRIAEVLGITLDELMGNEARADGKDGKAPAAEIVRVEVPVEVPVEVKRKIPWGKIVAIILACVVFVSACFVTGFWISKKIKEDELLKTELAKWQATDKFEAEWAHISAVAASLDTNGNVENTEYGSNGQCIAQFGVKGNTLTFNIVSSKSTTAQMYIAVVSHLEQDTPFYYITTEFDDVWNLYVNPTEDQIEKEEFIQTKQTYNYGYGAGESYGSETTKTVPIDYIFATKGDFSALTFRILSETGDKGDADDYYSDHFSIVATYQYTITL